MGATESESSNRDIERGEENKWKLWALIYAPRWAVSALALLALFVGLVALELYGPSTLEKLLTSDELASLFSAIVGAIITSVTLILTVTQLVISQEIGSLSEQNRRLEEQSEFRTQVEDSAGLVVSPSEPATFFRALIEATLDRGHETLEALGEAPSNEAEEIREYVEGVIEHGEQIREEIRGGEFGSFSVLSSVLDYNYSRKIHEARRLQNTYREALPTDVHDSLDDLVETLRFFGPTRGFFKTLYFQWELINVSRAMVYAALPGLLIAAYMILAFDAKQVTGSVAGVEYLYLLTSAAYAFTLVPFVLLLAYIVRILSVLKRTLAPGSFVLQKTDKTEEIHWKET